MTGFKVGDKGQRYEVRYTDTKGVERIMGWTKTTEGVDSFFKGIELHPNFHSPKVIDRQKENDGKEKK